MAKVLKQKLREDPKEAQPLSYTKHYYIGSERVSAKTGTMDKLGYYPLRWVTSEMPFLNIAVQDSSANRFAKATEVVVIIHGLLNVSQPTLSYEDNLTSLYDDTHDLRKLDVYYFHPDHLGSSSYITNMAGMVSQHMEYLPFGELLVDEHKNSYNSPFKYNGKEFDEETGNYFYGARYYDPKWSIFISVDPLAEKYPEKTPYHYVSNNPINRIDPDGRDDYELDKQGNIINQIINKKADSFHIVEQDSDGNWNRVEGKSISFKYGTIEGQRSQRSTYTKRNDDGSTEDAKTTVDIYKIRGDENGTKLFEFVSDNTNVEWGQAKTGVEGNKGLNFLTTGHVEYSEPGMSALINGQLYAGYTLREFNHNHPRGTAVPSGIPGFTGDTGDVPFARAVTEWYNKAYPDRSSSPTYNIYISEGKKYIPYNKDSKKSDYGY